MKCWSRCSNSVFSFCTSGRGRSRSRCVPMSADVLKYRAITNRVGTEGKLDADGFASDADWFAATLDATFPDAPRRLWDAFHGQCVSPPEIMITLHDGYCSGYSTLQRFI